MHTVCTLLILLAPLAVAAAFSWAARRANPLRSHLANAADGPDSNRVSHDADAVRTRFEQTPTWPSSGASGERR